jgi:hypothetical protein
MSKKLAAKAGLIQALNLPPVAAQRAAAEPAPEAARPKTAPGSMLQFMSSQSAAIKEAEDLKERLKAFDGASPVRLLDPQTIRPSKWANRHDASFESADFAELKSEIESAGGNVQPVRVRPLPRVLNGSTGVPSTRSCSVTVGIGPASSWAFLCERWWKTPPTRSFRGHGAGEPWSEEPERLGAGLHVPQGPG